MISEKVLFDLYLQKIIYSILEIDVTHFVTMLYYFYAIITL